MKSLYNGHKIYKNYQVNVGIPFQIKNPIHIKTMDEAQSVEQLKWMNQGMEDCPEDILQKAREEADMIAKEAQYEINRLFEKAEAEINEIRTEAEEEARKRGYEEGYNEARSQYEGLIAEAEKIKEQAQLEYHEVLAGIETDAVNMIMEITRKVIGREISLNKENLLYLIRNAFEKCTNRDHAVLKLSIEDYEFVSSNKDQLLPMVEGVGELEFKKEASMKAGDCIIETTFGSVDAGVGTQLDKIEDAFNEVIGK